MSRRFSLAILAALVACAVTGLAQADVYVAPKQGQSQQQFQQDQFDCHNWAQQQTGFNPSQPVVVNAPPPQTGGAIRGAAGGAAIGAVGGAIGGNAGKGAAIGAGVGATAGLIRQNRNNRAAADATRQAQAQQQAGMQQYESAYATCLQGRGYATSR